MNLASSSIKLAVLAGIALTTPAFAVVTIDYVPVGNAGNAADPATGSLYGAVAYNYQIASYSSSQNYLTDVGAYGLNSDSSYGTNDQAGNVWEWNDAVIGSSRGLRGGSWNNNSNNLAASNRNNTPTNENNNVGFRVARPPTLSQV